MKNIFIEIIKYGSIIWFVVMILPLIIGISYGIGVYVLSFILKFIFEQLPNKEIKKNHKIVLFIFHILAFCIGFIILIFILHLFSKLSCSNEEDIMLKIE